MTPEPLQLLLPADISTPADPQGGFGALRTQRGAMPLVALEVEAFVEGLYARVEVAQTFSNTYAEALEATYIFPLPDRAAVTEFRLEVAGRIVEGMLQERGQARRTYDAAVRAGHRVAIAEEDRAGVFTMRVGNLPPGERAVVRLTLVGPLPYSDGEVTFRFPLVVAPRYVPGSALPRPSSGSGVATDTDAVPDASRISPPVLLPGFPNPVRLSLAVNVPDFDLKPHSFRCSLHGTIEQERAGVRTIRVTPGERLDRDFILRWRFAGDGIGTSLAVRPDAAGGEGTFLLTVVPPSHLSEKTRPRDIVFVLDRSGSMSGWKMVAARRAVSRMVETLTPNDRFTIYAFDDKIETPRGFDGVALVPASDRQRFRAEEFLRTIDADGGTEMAEPLRKAVTELNRSGASADVDRVLVLITDGQVGNEDEILKGVAASLSKIRIFTLGIDRAVNAAFLRRLADLGRGSSEVVESSQRLDEVMDQIHRNIGTAILTGLRVSSAGLNLVPDSLTPARLPDLFAGAPVLIAGRYRGAPRGTIILRGLDAQGEKWAEEVSSCVRADSPLEQVWGRGWVRELEDRYAVENGERAQLQREIVATSIKCGVLSRFTAFVAVDRREVVNAGGATKKVIQAVEKAADWGQREAQAVQVAPPADGGHLGSVVCPVCHKDNGDGALFCEQCTTDLSSVAPTPRASSGPPPVPRAMAEPLFAEALPMVMAEPIEAEAFPMMAEPIEAEAFPMVEAEPMAMPALELAPMPMAEPMPVEPIAAPAPAPQPMPAPTPVPAVSSAPPAPAPAPAAETPAGGSLPPGAQPRLLVLRGQKRNVEYPIYEGDNYIGRADEKPVDIDLEEQEPPDRIWCSRQHARVGFENNTLVIEDLNSANGTYVNRTRVYPGQIHTLAINDVVQIGTVQFKVLNAAQGIHALRTRAEALRQRLETAADPTARLAALRLSCVELTNLVRDLREAGDTSGALLELSKHATSLGQLDANPSADILNRFHEGITIALREWLARPQAASGVREFWK